MTTRVHPQPIDEPIEQHRTEQDPANDRSLIEGVVGPTLVDVGRSAGGKPLKALRRRHPTAGRMHEAGPNVKLRGDGSPMSVSGHVVRNTPDVAPVAHHKTRAVKPPRAN
jgi:hypothetical protein